MPEAWKIAVALLAIAAWYVHAVAVNDLSDEEVDKLNLVAIGEDGDRPLINGTASHRQTRFAAYIAAFVLVVGCATLQWWLGLVATGMLVLNAAYSLPPVRVSARGGLAQLLLPLGYVGFPASMAVALAGTFSTQFFAAIAGLYLLFMGRLFLKDIRDEVGDRETGKYTFLVRHGLVWTLLQSGMWSGIGMLLMLVSLWGKQTAMLTVVLLLCMNVIIWNLRSCLIEPRLEYKLLRIAIVGRAASTWLFSVVLVVALQQYALDGTMQTVVLLAAMAMFGFGIVALFEELTAVKRRQVIALQQEVS